MPRYLTHLGFLLVLLATLIGAAHPTYAAKTYPAFTLVGQSTTWTASGLKIHSFDRLKNIPYKSYGIRRFFALTVTLTNTGKHAANLADDVVLVLKVMPPHFTQYSPGWTLVDKSSPLNKPMIDGAARIYGGALPWTVTRPRATTTYSYLIATNRGESHYGLYEFDPVKHQYVLLFPTEY